MRVPETSLLAAVLMLEIGLWCVALVTSMPYCFCCVGPAELWDRTDGFFGYVFAFLMEGVHHPAIRRQMYFYSAMVYLIGGGPYLLFKVTPHTAWDDYACACTMRVLCVYAIPRMHLLFSSSRYLCSVRPSLGCGAPPVTTGRATCAC